MTFVELTIFSASFKPQMMLQLKTNNYNKNTTWYFSISDKQNKFSFIKHVPEMLYKSVSFQVKSWDIKHFHTKVWGF